MFDSTPTDNTALRLAVYAGSIFQLPPGEAARRLVAAVRGLLRQALDGPIEEAASHLTPAELLRRVARVRRALASESSFRAGVQAVMAEVGFDPAANAFDVPRLRAVLPGGHDNPAAAAAYTAHRDTWYANPPAQVN